MSNPITPCMLADFHQVLQDFDQFWDREAVRAFHHPMFVREFADTAFAIRDGELIIAYLFGFFPPSGRFAYVHLVGVRESHRRQGLASQLYSHFEAMARDKGCRYLKAITTPQNMTSIAFHTGSGFELQGDDVVDEVKVIKDYAGIGQHRVVMLKEL